MHDVLQDFLDIVNAMALAAALLVFVAFSPTLLDAWRNRQHLTAGHLLALGIVLAMLGFQLRFSRWLYIDISVLADGWWVYLLGLVLGFVAVILFVAAVALSEPAWTRVRWIGYGVAFVVLSVAFWILDYITPDKAI